MSYSLKVGTTDRVQATVANVDLNPLCSFWVGYRFKIDAATQTLKIGEGFVALYLSHNSSQKIPLLDPGASGPQLAGFGATGALTLTGPGGASLVFDELDYMFAEDVECGNQAMQLHLLKFRSGTDGGDINKWINDDGWKYSPVKPEIEKANDGTNPLWRKSVNFANGDREASVIWRRRNATGLRALGVALPLQAKSFVRHWLGQANNQIPTLTLSAKDKNGQPDHWSHPFSAADIPSTSKPEGSAMVCHGAFSALTISEIVGPMWANAMQANQLPELSRLLMEVASRGSALPHSLRQLSDTATSVVVKPDNVPAQELFVVTL